MVCCVRVFVCVCAAWSRLELLKGDLPRIDRILLALWIQLLNPYLVYTLKPNIWLRAEAVCQLVS